MPRMIELIRASAVPATIMRSAARGALSLPTSEIVEILVYLAGHPVFGEQAQITLAGWDLRSLETIAADPSAPKEVLDYLSSPRNLRAALLPTLLENTAISETRLAELAAAVPHAQTAVFLASPRVKSLNAVMRALAKNPRIDVGAVPELQAYAGGGSAVQNEAKEAHGETSDDDADVAAYLTEHMEEVRIAEAQPFALVGGNAEETAPDEAAVAASSAAHLMAVADKIAEKSQERESAIQKIGKMTVGQRVQLAMKGSKDERFILIRDGARVVSCAVLESPKLTDSEVETFAAMKNVSDAVLRTIAQKRKFLKNYNVIRVLTSNPKCPIDVALALIPRLTTTDLKHLSINKNVADTIRKLSLKMYRERTQAR